MLTGAATVESPNDALATDFLADSTGAEPASENPLEVFWGQLNEETQIIPVEKFLEVARQAMGREVLKSELADREALVDELSARIPAKTLDDVRAKITVQNATTREAVK